MKGGERRAEGGKSRAWLVAFSLAPFPLFLLPPSALRPPPSEPWTVLLSGDADGYLAPCGCTSPMQGGMRRRATALRGGGDRTVRLDNGGLGAGVGAQSRMKAETAAQAIDRAGVDAANLAARDAVLGPSAALGLARLSGGRLVSTSLRPSATLPVEPWREAGPFLVGGATESPAALARELREGATEPAEAAHRLAQAAAERGLAPVLLFDGGGAAARALARAEPALRLVTYRSEGRPSSALEREGDCALATPGPRGKAVVRLAWDGARFATVTPETLGPTVPDDPAATALYRQYLRRVSASGLFEAMPDVPNRRAYAGSARCASCHAAAGKVWSASGHAHALRTLEDGGHARDPDCVACHVVSRGARELAFVSRLATPQLADVGCESCHGAGAAHAAAPRKARLPKVGAKACAPCHTPENSPRFDFATYWPRIKH